MIPDNDNVWKAYDPSMSEDELEELIDLVASKLECSQLAAKELVILGGYYVSKDGNVEHINECGEVEEFPQEEDEAPDPLISLLGEELARYERRPSMISIDRLRELRQSAALLKTGLLTEDSVVEVFDHAPDAPSFGELRVSGTQIIIKSDVFLKVLEVSKTMDISVNIESEEIQVGFGFHGTTTPIDEEEEL